MIDTGNRYRHRYRYFVGPGLDGTCLVLSCLFVCESTLGGGHLELARSVVHTYLGTYSSN